MVETVGVFWIYFTLSEFRLRSFAPVDSICSLPELAALSPSVNPLELNDKAYALCGFSTSQPQQQKRTTLGSPFFYYWSEQSDKQQALFTFPDNNKFTGNFQNFTTIYSNLHCKTQ